MVDTTSVLKSQFKMNRFKRFLPLSLMALPAVIYFIINNYMPIFGLAIAFKRVNYVDGIFHSPWVGLENFKFLFATPDAFVITRNTILYNLAFIALGLAFSVSIAILLSEINGSVMPKIYQTSFIIPYMVSYIMVGYIVYAFLNPDYGIANAFIVHILGKDAVSWYTTASAWPLILTFVSLWKGCGYSTIIYLAAIVGIDSSYYEASTIDGAGRWQRIKYIKLPMICPVIITLTVLAIGRIFYGDFGLFYQTTLNSGVLYPTTNIIDTYVYRALIQTGDIGMSSAAGFYQSICGFILVLITNLAVRKIDNENALF